MTKYGDKQKKYYADFQRFSEVILYGSYKDKINSGDKRKKYTEYPF